MPIEHSPLDGHQYSPERVKWLFGMLCVHAFLPQAKAPSYAIVPTQTPLAPS
jgi:hypothetical protein